MASEPSKGWRLYTEIFPEEYCILCCTTETGRLKQRRKNSSKRLLPKFENMAATPNET